MTIQSRLRSALGTALLALPDPVLEQFFSRTIGYGPTDVPEPIAARDAGAERRLLIAPANYAGQGYAWARSIRNETGVSAQNLTVGEGRTPRFATDDFVSRAVFEKSHRWGRSQMRAVVERFTHVLVEAQRPVLGRALRGDARAEHAALKAGGVSVGYVSHGSDLRLPSRHAELDVWSPFRDQDWEMLPVLEKVARENAALLDDVAEPEFVVTPELFRDRPDALWLPNTVHSEDWAVHAPLFTAAQLRLVHAPTNGRIKGTHLIEPTIQRLVDGGGFRYRRVEGVPAGAMRGVYAEADVVLEQFRLGIYSTTAIEAMAAGRLVVAHVADDVRRRVEAETGWEVPIVQATPDTLAEVLTDVRARPDHYRRVATQGEAFVRAVHSGDVAASMLLRFLGGPAID